MAKLNLSGMWRYTSLLERAVNILKNHTICHGGSVGHIVPSCSTYIAIFSSPFSLTFFFYVPAWEGQAPIINFLPLGSGVWLYQSSVLGCWVHVQQKSRTTWILLCFCSYLWPMWWLHWKSLLLVSRTEVAKPTCHLCRVTHAWMKSEAVSHLLRGVSIMTVTWLGWFCH